MTSKNKPTPTFEVRFVAPGLSPERVPLRAVTEVLSAVQDLASGRDPYETPHVPEEKSIGLLKVRRGSAVYSCISHAPDEARVNLTHIGALLSYPDEEEMSGDGLVAALRPIQSLSDAAKSVGCQIEISLVGNGTAPLFIIREDAYRQVSERLLLKGETSVIGSVERVGGGTSMRCMLRVPGRHRALYCDVESKSLVRRLGERLYEQIVATGTAVWIHRTWRIYQFTIKDFTQPHFGNPVEAIEQLRNAGLRAWDEIENPDALVRELRS